MPPSDAEQTRTRARRRAWVVGLVTVAVVVAGCSAPSWSAGPSGAASSASTSSPLSTGSRINEAATGSDGSASTDRIVRQRQAAAQLLAAGASAADPRPWAEHALQPWVLEPRYALVATTAAGGSSDADVLVAVRPSADAEWSIRALRVDRAANDPDVTGDQDAGAIVAEGSILLPGDFVGDDEARAAGSDCPGCRWRLDLACPQQGVLCGGALVGCSAGELRYVVRLLRPPATEFVVIGTVCRGPGDELLPVDELADRVRDRFVELLPRAAPAVQPSQWLLVQVPAILRSGEPETVGPVDARIAGYTVTLSGTPTWTWRFGDGGTLTTDRPGGRFPDLAVSHTYRRPGRYLVELETAWRGEFLVDGRGPYPVAGGPIVLDAALPIRVQEARAVLVAS